MALASQDIEFIKAHLAEWLAEQSIGKPLAVYEIELRERIVRAEEVLRHQGELIHTLIEQMNKRFEQMDKRFEQIDKRFEQVDKRFEVMTQRIDRFMIWSFGITMASAGVVIGVLRLWPPGSP